ncbi:hypothetical protein D0469_16985 [Peribacillus saganii]|uniref:Uncharacterized protein n=1 Tax=Peribacillus saganii TaxID=2303992 RepID=A0A372LIX6_9BACI|nr:hypothetical protein [Peribacillus saganii]RFU66332.1 hypothetical protein D0469_16985 [Peribacillus saganii]
MEANGLHSVELKEQRSFFQWISFFIPYIYTIGIILIVGWMIAASSILGYQTIMKSPEAFFFQNTVGGQSINSKHSSLSGAYDNNMKNTVTASKAKDTWLNTVVKPFIELPFNKIILRGLFLLLVWMLLFLVIPVAFARLKKFKLFNLEFEVEDKELAVIQTVEISGGKAKLMAYLTSDHASGKVLDFLTSDSSIMYQEALEYFLKEIQVGYFCHFNSAFSFSIHIGNFPEKLIDLVEESKESGEAVAKNKVDNDIIFKKNYLVYHFSFNGIEFVTLLSSYSYQFDVFDKYLIGLLHNVLNKNVENIEYMVALTSPNNVETG